MGKPIARPVESDVPAATVSPERRERLILLGRAVELVADASVFSLTTPQLRQLLAGA